MRTIKIRNWIPFILWLAIFTSPIFATSFGAPRWLLIACVVGSVLCVVLNVVILLCAGGANFSTRQPNSLDHRPEKT